MIFFVCFSSYLQFPHTSSGFQSGRDRIVFYCVRKPDVLLPLPRTLSRPQSNLSQLVKPKVPPKYFKWDDTTRSQYGKVIQIKFSQLKLIRAKTDEQSDLMRVRKFQVFFQLF